jgi:hypothetical protein
MHTALIFKEQATSKSQGTRIKEKVLAQPHYSAQHVEEYVHKMLNMDCLCSTCQLFKMTKKKRRIYGLLPPKIAEYDIVSLDHGLCVSGGSIYNKDTSQNTLYAYTHNDRSRNWLV